MTTSISQVPRVSLLQEETASKIGAAGQEAVPLPGEEIKNLRCVHNTEICKASLGWVI